MKKLLILLRGDIIRLFKYKIMWFSLAFSFMWVLILALSQEIEAKALMPMLMVMDTGVMAIILLASSFYYEKQENTIKSLFVSPVLLVQILGAKIIASLLMSIASILLISLTMLIVHGVVINYLLAIMYVFLSTLAHIAIGYVIVFYSADFASFLMKYMAVVLVLMLPTLLVFLGLIDASSEYFAIISPSYAIQYLIGSLFEKKDIWKIVIGVCVLTAVPAALFPFVVYPKYKAYAIKG
ncbi:MAG: hypothetical protein WC344_02925 [Bacilli bacterium]